MQAARDRRDVHETVEDGLRRETPGRLTPGPDLLTLQRSAGNQATAALVSRLRQAPAATARPLLQRKGKTRLMEGVAASTTPGLLAWTTDLMLKGDAHFVPVMTAIHDYDRLTDGRPSAQLAKLLVIKQKLDAYEPHAPKKMLVMANPNVAALRTILRAEVRTVQAQQDRLEGFTKDANAPYEQMTSEGALWNNPEWGMSAKRTGKRGREYFNLLSGANRRQLGEEISGSKDEEWVPAMLEKLRGTLDAAVLNHYTTSARAELMVSNKAAKSKTLLSKDSATYHHNTSAYDDYGLGNAGFVFFFIEAPGEPLRQTRFGEGAKDEEPSDRARISIPIKESGLLSNGWVMLSDFAQREYPTVAAKSDAPEKTASQLATRKKQEGFDLPVRSFQQGIAPLDPEEFIELEKTVPDQEQRTALTTVKAQVRGDEDSTMTYGTGGIGNQYQDRLFQNVLVAADIIPGLAERAVVETIRISKVNPALGERLKSMDGTQLMKFLLKDLLRPQAMVPNSVKVEERHIEKEAPKKEKEDPVKDKEPLKEDLSTKLGSSSKSEPTREDLIRVGLAQLDALADGWRERGGKGSPPNYGIHSDNIRSIVMAPEHLSIGHLEKEIGTWLEQAGEKWT